MEVALASFGCRAPSSNLALVGRIGAIDNLLIHESPLTDALFLLVSKSDEVTTT